MMTPSEMALKSKALEMFRHVLETYNRMLAISSVTLYYNGNKSANHGSVDDGDPVSITVKRALVDHWWDKLNLELSNVRSHGIDASAEMPSKKGGA